MNTFALDKNYSQLNFEEISIDDLEIISGGTGASDGWMLGGGSSFPWAPFTPWPLPSTPWGSPWGSYFG